MQCHDESLHPPSFHPQPDPVGDSDGPEQALPTDTAARAPKVVQIFQPESQNSRSNAERRGLGRNEGGGGADEGEKANGSLHGGQKEGFSNDLMAGGADGEKGVENGIKVSASCLHTDSSYLNASFLLAECWHKKSLRRAVAATSRAGLAACHCLASPQFIIHPVLPICCFKKPPPCSA